MSIILKDGTVLPDLPTEYVNKYPYAGIFALTAFDVTSYILYMTKLPMLYEPAELVPSGIADIAVMPPGYVMAGSASNGVEWNDLAEITDSTFSVRDASENMLTCDNITWSNHYIFEMTSMETSNESVTYTLGNVWFASSVTSNPTGENLKLDNRVIVPALPDDAIETYPYMVVAGNGTNNALLCTKAPALFVPNNVMGLGYDMLAYIENGYKTYTVSGNGWLDDGDVPDDSTLLPVGEMDGMIFEILWTNHDILHISAVSDDGIPVIDGVYYPCSITNFEEVYAVESDLLASIGRHVRRILGGGDRMTLGDIVEKLDSYVVTVDHLEARIGNTIREYSNDKITSIGSYAFAGCIPLENAEIPNATSIGGYAFIHCFSLLTANFSLATEVGMYAFSYCSGLTTLDFPLVANAGTHAFYSCSNVVDVNFPKLQTIDSYTFANMKKLENAIFPCLETINGNYNFANCEALKKIDFPVLATLGTSTYGGVFDGCTALETVILRNTERCAMTVDAFENSGISAGTGYIYVPSTLVDSYKTANIWSTYASQIRAIEDYPDICGTTEVTE